MGAAMLSQNRMIDVRPSNEEVEYKGGIRRDRESGVVLSRASGGLRLSVGTGHARESLCSGAGLIRGHGQLPLAGRNRRRRCVRLSSAAPG